MNEKDTIQVGDEVRVGCRLMIVDEIIDGTLWCIDEDGQDFELTEDEVDIY